MTDTTFTVEFPSDQVKNGTYDMKKLCILAKALYHISLKAEGSRLRTRENGSVQVVINSNLIQTELKLTAKEVDIIKGIIMVNGHTYYEI